MSRITAGGDKPHAVTGVTDENVVISSAQCDVTWGSRNRATSISEDGWNLDIGYGIGLQREKSVLRHGSTTVRTTHYISGDSEREITASGSRYIDYIYADGRIVALHVHNTAANSDSLYYVQTDLLGSWDRIVDENRNVVQASHFDPWGNRMKADDWTSAMDGTDLPFHRGFTGHEHYDRFGIINMNARLYDPVIARFFSPDPQIQDPYSTQGFNRYSYCGNNPVMYSDPTGEFFLIDSWIYQCKQQTLENCMEHRKSTCSQRFQTMGRFVCNGSKQEFLWKEMGSHFPFHMAGTSDFGRIHNGTVHEFI